MEIEGEREKGEANNLARICKKRKKGLLLALSDMERGQENEGEREKGEASNLAILEFEWKEEGKVAFMEVGQENDGEREKTETNDSAEYKEKAIFLAASVKTLK